MIFAREAGWGISLVLIANMADSQKRLIAFLILRLEGLAFESAYTPVVLAPYSRKEFSVNLNYMLIAHTRVAPTGTSVDSKG
jgi:hypothetical protein